MTADLAPTSEVVVEPVLEDDPDSQLVDDTQTHVQIVEAAERERAAERRSHRAILAPRSTTPHCARTCQPIWERCSANCTADERGCVLACRRELSICSRSCY